MLTIEKKSLKVGRYVDTQHADTLLRTYKQERWAQNSEKLGKEDSLSVWYSIEELEAFIAKAKDHGGNGVRIYFGAYPDNFEKKPEYSKMQTVVLVASKGKENEAGRVDHKDIYIGTTHGTSILAYNAGQLCPPICPGGKGGGVETGIDSDDWGGIGTTLVDRGDKGMVIV